MNTTRLEYPIEASPSKGFRLNTPRLLSGIALAGVIAAGFAARDEIVSYGNALVAIPLCQITDCGPSPEANIDPLQVMSDGK